MVPRRLALTLLALALGSAGCPSFRQLEHELEQLAHRRVVGLTVENPDHQDGVHVAILFHADTKRVEHVSLYYGPGRHELHVRPGRYHVAAFEDLNENAAYDEGEPGVLFEHPHRIEYDGEGRPLEIEVELSDSEPDAEHWLALRAELVPSADELQYNNLGVVTRLEDPRFDRDVARSSMWEPWEFVEQGLPGIYMLAEHDPNRVPVLFVHGIGGTPREFSELVESLDRTKFQAWIAYYPSAERLGQLGDYLRESIDLMVRRFEVPELVVVAHSMGGLVTFDALLAPEAEALASRVKLLITIASPLGGLDSAKLGVDWAPTVMPSWYDLVPNSPFIERLSSFEKPDFPYHAFFAFHRSGLFGPSGDGVAPLTSQLSPYVQELADGLIGIDAEHTGALHDPQTLRHVKRLLLKHAAP